MLIDTTYFERWFVKHGGSRGDLKKDKNNEYIDNRAFMMCIAYQGGLVDGGRRRIYERRITVILVPNERRLRQRRNNAVKH